MRFYGFGNYYLSSIQQGIQNLHVLGELIHLYSPQSKEFQLLVDWSKNHKTAVLLNGGNSSQILNLFEFFQFLKSVGMNLPFALFHEDQQSLGSAPTACGIIVPTHIYEFASSIRNISDEDEQMDLASISKIQRWELRLASKLNEFNLAH